MTTQTIHIQTYDHGASLTSATLRTIDTDTLVATADTVNEVTADGGLYAAVFGEVSVITAGDYRLRAVVGGQPINRYVTLAGVDAEVVQSRSERYAVLDTATIGYLTSIVASLGAWTGTGVNTVLGAFKALLSKVASTPSDIGGTFNPANDSTEAIRDRGDAAWTTGAGGGGGGGSPVFTAVVVARIASGSAAGWPEELIIGDAYLTENASAQPLFIKDVEDNILSGLGTKLFSDGDFVATLRLAPLTDGTRSLDTPPTTIEVKSTDLVGILYNDDTAGAEYFELQIPRSKTLLGVTKTKYSCQFIMNWGEDETFERTVNLGEIKFLRKNAPAA